MESIITSAREAADCGSSGLGQVLNDGRAIVERKLAPRGAWLRQKSCQEISFLWWNYRLWRRIGWSRIRGCDWLMLIARTSHLFQSPPYCSRSVNIKEVCFVWCSLRRTLGGKPAKGLLILFLTKYRKIFGAARVFFKWTPGESSVFTYNFNFVAYLGSCYITFFPHRPSLRFQAQLRSTLYVVREYLIP